MAALAGRRIVLGLTGGIACYKAATLCRELVRQGATVNVVMTDAAREFITPTTLQALSGHPVATSQWDTQASDAMAHIHLTRGADALLIAPCTANVIGKLAHGIADDLLTTLAIARACPLLVAPAMNVEMWEQAAVQRNVEQLKHDGISVLGPAPGEQACGEVGMGRMLEPEALVSAVIAQLQPKVLRGRRVLMTAGPTFEPIDPVRGITNLSSGKMGFAVAQAAADAGADVVLVSGPVHLSTPWGVRRIDVLTAEQMQAAVLAELEGTDIFIGVAAVADWKLSEVSTSKLKKEAGPPVLSFAPNPDILAAVAAQAGAQGGRPYCVGFAAESEDLLRLGSLKRQRKGIPLLAANIGHETFGRDDNELLLIDEHGAQSLGRSDKLTLARALINAISQRLGAAP